MVNMKLYSALIESGIEIDKVSFTLLDEANQIKVADETLTSMMKFITDKYNSIDFSEIEKSTGDYRKFKYAGMIRENLDMLSNVYESSNDPGAKNYIEVINKCYIVQEHLISNAQAYSVLYKQGNGLVQLTYTSLVSAIIYTIGAVLFTASDIVLTDNRM